MKTIDEMLTAYLEAGFNLSQANNLVAQEIILLKISSSPLADQVLLKGGVVMYNLTKNQRRTTSDLDFDMLRYDITHNESIDNFVKLLNKNNDGFMVLRKGKIETLNQEDYRGKRVHILIKDKTNSIKFKFDIGVHTLLNVQQINSEFKFLNCEDKLVLRINPPEQMISEKLYSLHKHGSFSTRFKDLFDIYYLIKNNMVNKKLLIECLNDLCANKIIDISTDLQKTFSDSLFIENFEKSKEKWLDVDYLELTSTIYNYIKSI